MPLGSSGFAVTAKTQPAATDNNRAATTAFVHDAIEADIGGLLEDVTEQAEIATNAATAATEAKDDAEAALAGVNAALALDPSPESVTALLSLTQTIGTLDGEDDTGAAVGNSTWIIATPAPRDLSLATLRIYNPQSSAGTIKFKRFSKSGDVFSREGGTDYDIDIDAGPGWVEAVAADFGVVPLLEGEYPAIYVGFDPGGGVVQYMGHLTATQPGNGYYRNAGGAGNQDSITDVATTTNDKLLIGFDFAYVTLTAPNLKTLEDEAERDNADLETFRSAMMEERFQILGRQETPVDGDAPAAESTIVFAKRTVFDSILRSVSVRCHSAGVVHVRAYERTSQTSLSAPATKELTFTVASGANSFTGLDLFIPAGWHLGLFGPFELSDDIPTTLSYTAQTANFHVYENPGDVLTGATSGAVGAIINDVDSGTTGTLTLSQVDGTFVNGEIITDNLGGSATANVFTAGTNFPPDSCGVFGLTGDSTGGTLAGATVTSVRYEVQFVLERHDFGRETVGVMPGEPLPLDQQPPRVDDRGRLVIGESTTMGSRSTEYVFDPDVVRDTVVSFGGITRSAPLGTYSTGLVQAEIEYDTQTVNFSTGTDVVLTGGTSGATCRCLVDVDSGTSGTLTVTRCVGTFVPGEIISATSGGHVGSATVVSFTPSASFLAPATELFSTSANNWANQYESQSVDRGNTGWVQAAYAIQDKASAELGIDPSNNKACLILSGWGGERIDHRDGIGFSRKWLLCDELLRAVKAEYDALDTPIRCLTVWCGDGPNNAAQGLIIDQNRAYTPGDFDMTVANFKTQAKNFYVETRALVRSIFGRADPVRFINVPTSLYVRGSGNFSEQPRLGVAQQAFVELAKELPWFDAISSDFEDQCCDEDSVHFSARGATTHAHRYAIPTTEFEFMGRRPAYARPLGARFAVGSNVIEWLFWSPTPIVPRITDELITLADSNFNYGVSVTIDNDTPITLDEPLEIDNAPGLWDARVRILRQEVPLELGVSTTNRIHLGMHFGRPILPAVDGVRPPGSGKDEEGYHQLCETPQYTIDCDGTLVTINVPLPICQATAYPY